MVRIVLLAVIMEVLIVAFTLYIFDNIGKRINTKLKQFFVDKLQDYNFLIEEKEKQLEELRKDINREKARLKELQPAEENMFSMTMEEQLQKMKLFKEGRIRLVDEDDIVFNFNTPDFREEEFFNNYKKIKKNFKVNVEQVITKFVNEHKNTTEQENVYESLVKLKMKFNDNSIYELLTLTGEDQYEILNEVLSVDEKTILDFEEKFKNDKNFSILLLLEEINNKIKENDPTIYVYLSEIKEKYSKMSKHIKLFEYKNMSEGVIIHYKGKMYDYSI